MAESTAKHGNVVHLHEVRHQRVNWRSVAQMQMSAARSALGMSIEAFAQAMTEALGWPVSPRVIDAWESQNSPSGEALLAAQGLAAQRTGVSAGPMLPPVGPMRIVDNYLAVQAALAEVVDGAEEYLAITGSRSRDPDYLMRIEDAVASRPDLVHYRVLYGPPRHGALKNHLLRLVDLQRDPGSLMIGMYSDLLKDSERFLCASESLAVIVLPSANSVSNFDTALVLDDPDKASSYTAHVRQAYLGSQALTTRSAIENLEVLR